MKDCTGVGMNCGCTNSSTGATVIAVFDKDMSCTVTDMEIKANMALANVLSPDLDFDGDKKPEMLSVVVRATAKKATFDAPKP